MWCIQVAEYRNLGNANNLGGVIHVQVNRKDVFAMKNFIPRLIVAATLVLLLFSSPLWFPNLQALAAPDSHTDPNPFADTPSFYILDNGWTAGSLTQKVLAVPQVFSWSTGDETANWIAETGFIYGGFHDLATGNIYITEQRNKDHESLLNVSFAGDVLYASSSDWGMYLTMLNGESGEVLSRVALTIPARDASGASLHPIGINGNTLFLMNYAAGRNLFAYDLNRQQVDEQTWSLCEEGYLIKAKFMLEPIRIAALCLGRDNGSGATVTLTNLETDEQSSIVLPILGKEEYQTGNGMFIANGSLFAIDSEVGVLVKIDMDTMEIVQTSNYRDALAQQKSNWMEDVLVWLGNQIVSPAAAKRFMSITAVSPDGRWLAVDGGAFADNGASNQVLLVDLQTLQATQSFDLGRSPLQLEFATNTSLLVLFDKPGRTVATPGVLLDLSTGNQQEVAIPTHGWVHSILAANN
jgi:hypothetical protein